jgi:DNA-binding NarL/FixJ family response regulator
VDPALEGESAVELIPVARERGIKVLLYTDTQNGSAVEAARNSGAEGVIAKSGTPAQFLEAIRVVSRGETYRDPQVHPYAGAESPPDLLALTAREREIATLLSKGLTGEQIAKLLFLSPETVRTHVRNAMGRTGAKTRAHLAALVASVPRPDSIAAPKRSLRDASPSRRRQRGR